MGEEGRRGGGGGREDTGAGACSLRVGVGPGGAGSRGFGRRGGDICGEPWGPNQASDWQGEQTALTLAAPHCPTLPQEWLGAGLLSAVLWATGASGQEPRCAWDLLPCFLPRLGCFHVLSLSPCLHLSVPPGDSGSPPPWRTAQPVPSSAASPLEARALSHPGPQASPPLCPRAASPFFSPLTSPQLRAHAQSH